MSTNCRGCNTYLKIENGIALPPVQYEDTPRYQKSPTEEAPASPQGTTPVPKSEAPVTIPEAAKKKKPISPLPVASKEPTKNSPSPSAPTPPLPKEAPPAASIPRTLPRNPLPKKPAKPKAPPPPPKPEPLQSTPDEKPAKKASPKDTPATIQPEPAEPELPKEPSERYRPPAASSLETSKPKIAPLINREKKRNVKCFECDESHEILADSTSALCPHCGAYIGLKNYDIREQENSRIQTRGNVFVHKKGYITGITIHAHNLTIEGEIQGGAECTGDFIIRKTGKIKGPVSSDRVIIERRAKVDFESTVEAREVIIDGHVTGSVACKKLTLKKRATLDGDLTVASLSVEEGAKHTGNIKMTGLL